MWEMDQVIQKTLLQVIAAQDGSTESWGVVSFSDDCMNQCEKRELDRCFLIHQDCSVTITAAMHRKYWKQSVATQFDVCCCGKVYFYTCWATPFSTQLVCGLKCKSKSKCSDLHIILNKNTARKHQMLKLGSFIRSDIITFNINYHVIQCPRW